jgi:hypothetical protein
MIAHDGGGCPVAECVSIYCMLRCGIIGWAMRHASAWEWDFRPMISGRMIIERPTDIIAYKPEQAHD